MTRTALLLLLALPLLGCRSHESTDEARTSAEGGTFAVVPECRCGEPDADLYGCAHPACVEGGGDPENPLCACGPLRATGVRATSVSYGSGSTSRQLGQPQALMLADGRLVRGVLRSDDGLSVTLETAGGGERTLAYDELAPRSVYRLMKGRVSKDDGEGLIELGDYTRDHGLYAYSKRHYQEALRADPDLRPRLETEAAKLRDVASKDLLERARTALAEGDTAEAEKQLSRILSELPNEPAAQTARSMMSDLAQRAEARRARAERETEAPTSKIQEELDPARRHLARAEEENRKGMLASSGSSTARRHFDRAVAEGERGRRKVASAVESHGSSTGFRTAAASLDHELVDVLVSAHLNLAGLAMTKSSFNDALDEANAALVLDPNRAEARSMKTRVENASATSGWGYGWGGWYLGSRGAAVRSR